MSKALNRINYQGRYCVIPHFVPSELGTSTFQNLKRGAKFATTYQPQLEKSSLQLAMDNLDRVEQERKKHLVVNVKLRKERGFQSIQNNFLHLDNVQWTLEEDLTLREAVERWGNDWERIARYLKARKRTDAECRERFEAVCKQILCAK